MDRRQEKTQRDLYKSFTELLLTKDYGSITVLHILKGANVGRTTFYSHFSTKDELLSTFCVDVFGFVAQRAGAVLDSKSKISETVKSIDIKTYYLLETLKNNYNNVLELINCRNSDIILKHFKVEMKKYICDHLKIDLSVNSSKTDRDFLVSYISSTFFEILQWWTDNNMKDSTESIVKRFHDIIDPVIENNLYKKTSATRIVNVDSRFNMERKGEPARDIRIQNYLNALEILSQSTDDFLFLLDINGHVNWFFGPVDKDYAVRKTGADTNTTLDMMNIIYPADRMAVSANFKSIAGGKTDVHNMNYRWINRDGNPVWINSRGKVIFDKSGKPFVMIGRVSEEAMRHLFNPLTGLFNKVKMREDLRTSLHKYNQGYLMLLDIDDLAAINLSHGRKYGDSLLKELATLIENNPAVDRIYHTELSYFAVWFKCGSEQEIQNVFYGIRDAMEQKCSVSAGVVPLDDAIYIDHSNLYDSAKITLHKAKEIGKGSISFLSPDDMKRSIYSVELIEELHESVAKDFKGFKVNFQPQVCSGSYKVFSLEALMRYHSPTRGPVYPDEFIPLLEKTGLINPVGIWILTESLTKCKEWRKHIPDLRVSVNFSTVQFRDKYIVDKILSALKETGMPGNSLTIEITESIPLNEIDRFSIIIGHLKQEGIQIAIDDFGTGYSNIGYLKKLDVDEIKIDRMFVSDIEEDTYNYMLISNTVEFAKMNSIRICCEGVETSKELAVLETLSPNLLQGYLFDKPCEPKEFEEAYIDKNSEKYNTRIKFIEQLYAYKEQMGVIHFKPMEILRETNVGLWVIRVNVSQNYHELYADETMENILGLDKKYSPREIYDFWFSRIDENYLDYVIHSFKTMSEKDKVVQLRYKWNHPTLGTVEVRSSGRRIEDTDGLIVLEGYHRIFSNIEEV